MGKSYHWAVACQSWDKTVADCVGKTASATIIRVAAFFLTLVLAYLYVDKIDENSLAFDDASLAAVLAFGVSATIFVGGLIFNLLFLVPAVLWREQSGEIGALRTQLTPAVSFNVENGGFPKEFPVGTVQQVASGDYVSNHSGNARFICARIENLSAVDVEAVLVTLTRLQSEASGKALSDPVELTWHNRRWNGGYEFIPASSPRTALLFQVGSKIVYFAGSEKLSLDQVNFIDDEGPYRGQIAVTHGNGKAPLMVDFVLKIVPEPHLVVVSMG